MQPLTRLFRSSIFLLIAFLSIIYNAERVQYAAGLEVIGVHNFLYLLILVFVSKIIFLPPKSSQALWGHIISATALYFLLRTTLFMDGGIIGGVQTYVTVTELLILVLSIYLIAEVMKHFSRLEKMLNEVYAAELDRQILGIHEGKAEIDKEVNRSRRYSHPLSLMVIKLSEEQDAVDLDALLEEIRRNNIKKILNGRVLKILSDEARRTDLIIRSNAKDFSYILISPETGSHGSEVLAKRIQGEAAEIGITLKYGIASFPDQALTYDDLRIIAEKNLGSTEGGIERTDPAEAEMVS